MMVMCCESRKRVEPSRFNTPNPILNPPFFPQSIHRSIDSYISSPNLLLLHPRPHYLHLQLFSVLAGHHLRFPQSKQVGPRGGLSEALPPPPPAPHPKNLQLQHPTPSTILVNCSNLHLLPPVQVFNHGSTTSLLPLLPLLLQRTTNRPLCREGEDRKAYPRGEGRRQERMNHKQNVLDDKQRMLDVEEQKEWRKGKREEKGRARRSRHGRRAGGGMDVCGGW